MNIETEDDVKALSVRRLRESLELSQAKFWEMVGVSPLRGHRYENGITHSIPRDVRRMVFLHYVIGIPTDASPESLRKLKLMAELSKPLEDVNAKLEAAAKAIASAKETLNAIEPKPHLDKRR